MQQVLGKRCHPVSIIALHVAAVSDLPVVLSFQKHGVSLCLQPFLLTLIIQSSDDLYSLLSSWHIEQSPIRKAAKHSKANLVKVAAERGLVCRFHTMISLKALSQSCQSLPGMPHQMLVHALSFLHLSDLHTVTCMPFDFMCQLFLRRRSQVHRPGSSSSGTLSGISALATMNRACLEP